MLASLDNYILGQWFPGEGEGLTQYHAVTGAPVAVAAETPDDCAPIFDFARRRGGPALRRLTLHERGRLLKALANYLLERKEKYYTLAVKMGASRYDAWLDIEGGIGSLFAYGALRHQLPDQPYWLEEEVIALAKEGGFSGRHIWVPRPGVALHVNPFCMPVRHFLEKTAVSLMAGMPVVIKASEQTSFMVEAVMRDIVESSLLPTSALQLIVGPGHDLARYLTGQDVATFTGQAASGLLWRQHLRPTPDQPSLYFDAESINVAVLGEDAGPDTPDFDLFVRECRREMTIGAGQRCTATRRIVVPEKYAEAVKTALIRELSKVTVGDPARDDVHMGPLANQGQLARVTEQTRRLSAYAAPIFGDVPPVDRPDTAPGAFLPPLLMWAANPLQHPDLHRIECFGPVATLMPYRHLEEAIELARLSGPSLVGTFCSNDRRLQEAYTWQTAAFHGRIVLLNRESAKNSPGAGVALPLLHHSNGNPGGLAGLRLYSQRTAIEGHPDDLTALVQQYHAGAGRPETAVHPFQKNFTELQIGETWTTARHTVNVADLHHFASVSGDYFFAHMDETQAKDAPYGQRTAHPFFVLARAVGLLTEAKKGAMLLTFGLDSCRFIKPVYPGATIGVKLTVQEKIPSEPREARDVPKGTVKWRIEASDEKNETVMTAVLLTFVKC
jgi:oxepin-CoA hydrolase / 3-oxo-5,6-dehydrosuberyl-CoA semialdehyde dehydrogenase